MKGVEKSIIPVLKSRSEYFDYFDYYSLDIKEALAQRTRTGALVKSYILETVAGSESPQHIDLEYVFRELGLTLKAIDEALFRIEDQEAGGTIALLEMIEDRHPTVYTLLDAVKSDTWIKNITLASPWLDQVWLSAPFFQHIWTAVERITPAYRYTKVGFEYVAAYETLSTELNGSTNDDVDTTDDELDLDAQSEDEDSFLRRTTRVTLVDRISKLSDLMKRFDFYAPLHSMTQLRLPAANRGGDDIYYDGKVTNRTDSFLGHRQNDKYIAQRYKLATTDIEKRAWLRESQESTGIFGTAISGAPFEILFSAPLDPSTFRHWIATLKKKNNRFRLSGFFNELSPLKIHMVGIDRHLGQPIMLEFTNKRVVGLLPEHTCGNTIHRLITNVQRMIDPAATAFVGSHSYEQIIATAFEPVAR